MQRIKESAELRLTEITCSAKTEALAILRNENRACLTVSRHLLYSNQFGIGIEIFVN